MTAREITDAVLEGKAPEPTRKQAMDVQAARLAALRKRDGKNVAGEGSPARWKLEEATTEVALFLSKNSTER